MAAAQEFTGRDLRTRLRLNYVHTLQPDWGLTAQLRTRYFHRSHPGEFDYFSLRDFVQITPTLQLRRRPGAGATSSPLAWAPSGRRAGAGDRLEL